MGEVGTLCSGLPSCCCGWGQRCRSWMGGSRESPLCWEYWRQGVCMPGPSGDWCKCTTHSSPRSSPRSSPCSSPHSNPTQLLQQSPHTTPSTQFPPTQLPPQLPPHSPPNNSLHTTMYAQVNVKPDEEEHTNSNVGTHNIAIGGTLGWSKQQQGWSKQKQHYRYSHLMQSG